MKKKRYIAPNIRSYQLPELCSGINNATVYKQEGQSIDSTFKVNETDNPDGTKNDDWFDNVDKWGGD